MMEVATKELVTIDASQFGVDKNKAKQLESIFSGLAAKLSEYEQPFSEIIQEAEKEVTPDLAARAKRLRLDIGRAVRIPTEKARKEEKEDVVRRGKAIDGLANIIKDASYDFENPLKKIEDHAEIMEQKRREELQAVRVKALSKYVEDADERNLSDMDEDVWQAYLSTKKKEYEDRIEAERQAELERIEAERKQTLLSERKEKARHLANYIEWERLTVDLSEEDFKALMEEGEKAKAEHLAEQKRIQEENLRLQKEKEEAEKAAEAERQRLAKIEAERKKKEEAERKAHEAALAKEREEKAKLEAEIKAKAEAEQKAREEAAEAERKAALAPEKDRLKAWVSGFELPALKGTASKDSQKMVEEIESKFIAFKKWATKEIESIQ